MGAALVIAAAPSAFAAQAITVSNANADGSITAHADLVSLADATSGISFECETAGGVNASDSTGTIPSGSHTAPADVGDLNVSFNNCAGPLGAVTATPSEQPYDLTIESFDAATGVSTGYVGPVNVHVSMLGCEFDVIGNAPGRYDNNTGVLTVTPDVALPSGVAPLEPVNISGCLGFVNPGDELTYEGDYQLTSPATPITISSP
ncbi:hypothetical protein BAY60_11375 [Prauserella muralis]|uniref:Uncharacterized protein n=2 Tax=Prauserella muralis TaxID=588067 RepID=A0A2V4BBR3_9PSEU|nr:hypothetical protein BAY60_11375 [Prauserella muralis]